MDKVILRTEVNEKGKKVFIKRRKSKTYYYFDKGYNPYSKQFILENKDRFLNVGVSGDTIYPVEIKIPNTNQFKTVADEFYKVFDFCKFIIPVIKNKKILGFKLYIGDDIQGEKQFVNIKVDDIPLRQDGPLSVFDIYMVFLTVSSISRADDFFSKIIFETCKTVKSENDSIKIIRLMNNLNCLYKDLNNLEKKLILIFDKWCEMCLTEDLEETESSMSRRIALELEKLR